MAQTGTVIPAGLNLRETPGGTVIKVLPQGTTVEILEDQGNFLKVTALGETGFVAAHLINRGGTGTGTGSFHFDGNKAVAPDGTVFGKNTCWESSTTETRRSSILFRPIRPRSLIFHPRACASCRQSQSTKGNWKRLIPGTTHFSRLAAFSGPSAPRMEPASSRAWSITLSKPIPRRSINCWGNSDLTLPR